MRAGLAAIALALAACSSPSAIDVRQPVCDSTRQFTEEWSALTDQQLQVEIAHACGRVSVGFKEQWQVRGVDPYGKNLTSDATTQRMKDWLRGKGLRFEFEFIDIPSVVTTMPAELGLVREIRHHPNVDYLEPIFPGVRWIQP